ncbi:MAG TPA: TetR/AcrR family transcriptional regulator [Jatrophihabitantaceae bacterium]|nr:TetR/AcrR family transcriptional regulator [Jatrophihabitantaceae bacterium]
MRTGDTSPAGDVPDGRRLRWTEHREHRRAAFVAAGAKAIDEFGPAASAEQIADSAGVSRTVLYRYFRDREDLRQAIADHVVRAVLDSVLPKLAISPEATPREIIRSAIAVIVGWLDEHPNLYYFLRSRRDGASLDSVEGTLADNVAALLKTMMMLFGIDNEQAEPGAYGIVGFVESIGSWWLQHRGMGRERLTDLITIGVWHLLDGTARDLGIELGFDDPLPVGALSAQET